MDSNEDFKKEKKRIYKKTFIVFMIVGFLFAGVIGYGVYWLFYDWSRFKQALIIETTSPNGTYTIRAYLSNGGATTSFTVLGELIFNKEGNKSKKIYWGYREQNAEIRWVDDDTVIINDVQLELPHKTYDFRRGVR